MKVGERFTQIEIDKETMTEKEVMYEVIEMRDHVVIARLVLDNEKR